MFIKKQRFFVGVLCFFVITSALLWNTRIHTCDSTISYINSIEI